MNCANNKVLLWTLNSSAAGDWVNCGICGEWAHFGCDRRQGLGAFKVMILSNCNVWSNLQIWPLSLFKNCTFGPIMFPLATLVPISNCNDFPYVISVHIGTKTLATIKKRHQNLGQNGNLWTKSGTKVVIYSNVWIIECDIVFYIYVLQDYAKTDGLEYICPQCSISNFKKKPPKTPNGYSWKL